MSEPTITLVIDLANVEFASIDGLNAVTKIPYNWTATPDDGVALTFPGIVELGPVDPDHYTDVAMMPEEDLQDFLGGWVKLELGRERVRQVKTNMTAILAARETATVKLFAPPEPEPEPEPIPVPDAPPEDETPPEE